MPWDIVRREDSYCVVKSGTQEVEGCHETRGEAVAQLRALNAAEAEKTTSYANVVFNLGMVEGIAKHLQLALDSISLEETKEHVKEAQKILGDLIEKKLEKKMMEEHHPHPEIPGMPGMMAAGKVEEYAWEGPIVFEGVKTGDNRIFMPGSIEWDAETLPWAFRWQKSSTKGHDGAVPIGRVDKLERKEDGSIYGYGVIIPSLNEEAAEYLRLLEAGVASGVSVDGDSAVFDVQEMVNGESQVVFSNMRLRSLTAVDIPAFHEARVDLVDEDDNKDEFGGKPSKGTSADLRIAENKKRKMALRVRKAKYGLNDAITASAIPIKPKTEWFQDPKFDGPTGITVSKDGAVFGHLALFDTCHIGFPGCVTPPKGSDYKYFHTGEIETEVGDLVEVGHLTFNTGHASMQDSAKAAAAHYDHTGTVAADVRCGEDEFGIWVAGALRPGLTDEQIREFRAAPLSGDWRRISGRLELVGALAVNVPGFPVPRARAMVASGETETLITFEEFEVDDNLRITMRDLLSDKVEFHLIGKHDQSSHGGGGRGAHGGLTRSKITTPDEARSRDKTEYSGTTGLRRQFKDLKSEIRAARNEALIKEPDAATTFKSVVKKNGTVRLNPLKASDVSAFSNNQLKTLNKALDASERFNTINKSFAVSSLSPVSYAVTRWREKRLPVQQRRIRNELQNRDITPEFGLKSLVYEKLISFQTETNKEISLAQEIDAARKLFEGKPFKELSDEQKQDALFSLRTLIDGLKDEGDAKEDEVTPEIIAGLEAELKKIQ